ncbi:MAG: hypothetical protein R3D57_02560 [Hyphomicrobiaceae bacterium]
MQRCLTLLAQAAVLASLVLSSSALAEDAGDIEPPLQYRLQIGEQTREISEGVPTVFEGSFTNPAATLVVAPERIFAYGGIRFEYPRHYTFEADFSSPGLKIWTLSGNSFKIMYFLSEQPLTALSLLEGMSEQLGDSNLAIEESQVALEAAGQSLAGKRGVVSIAIQKLSNDAFTLPERNGLARVLLLQDALMDEGGFSEEASHATAMLQKSLALEP